MTKGGFWVGPEAVLRMWLSFGVQVQEFKAQS